MIQMRKPCKHIATWYYIERNEMKFFIEKRIVEIE